MARTFYGWELVQPEGERALLDLDFYYRSPDGLDMDEPPLVVPFFRPDDIDPIGEIQFWPDKTVVKIDPDHLKQVETDRWGKVVFTTE